MNLFKVKKIKNNKIIAIINVGSYKVRVAICSFSFSGIKILWYWEKRQSRLDIINNEINNLSGVYETIKEALEKAELEVDEKVEEIVINPFFTTSYFYTKNILYKNKTNETELKIEDVSKIISFVEKNSLDSIFVDIERKYWYSKDELEIILSNILEINIDWEKKDSLLWEKAEDIKIKILNTLISKYNYELLENIAVFLEKKIYKIIPEEYSITKLANKDCREVFVDIWNSSTSISITNKDWTLFWALRIDIWIWDLLKTITKKYNKSRVEVIKKLTRDDLFKKEKQDFLVIFSDILIEWLKELLQWQICPSDFILVGGWAYNKFIEDFLRQKDFNSMWVKILKNINFKTVSIEQIKKIWEIEKILNISNINIVSQIIATNNILLSSNNLTQKILKDFIEKKIINS